MSFWVPRKEPPNRAPAKRDAPFPEPSNYLLKFPGNGLSRFPNRPLQRERERDTCLQSFLLHLSLKVPSKRGPHDVPKQDPFGDRSFISRANGLFLHLYMSESPVRSPPMKNGEKIWSPSVNPHVDGRPTRGLVPQGDELVGVWISPGLPCIYIQYIVLYMYSHF
jgi:hypothetical protein